MNRCLPPIIAALGLVAGGATALDGVDRALAVLEARGVAVSVTNAERVALEAVLRSVDPGARLCSPVDAEALRTEAAGPAAEAGGTSSVAMVEPWPEAITYIKVRGLFAGGGHELAGHVRALAGCSGVILDFRGADGADLPSVVELASPCYAAGDPLFDVVDSRGRPESRHVAAEAAPYPVSLMVLTDRDTARAAETLAALWRGRRGIMVLGAPTRGDAGIRELLPLADGWALYVATGRVAPGNGPGYQGRGVTPDVVVREGQAADAVFSGALSPARPLSVKSEQDRELAMRVDGDAVLRRATDILLGLKALGGYVR
jgi:hypothetical protein